MAEVTRKLAENIRRRSFFAIITAASNRCLVENFQLICYSQRVNAMWKYDDSGSAQFLKMVEQSDGYSGETLLSRCARKKKLQRKMTKDNYWIGAEENVSMFSKS